MKLTSNGSKVPRLSARGVRGTPTKLEGAGDGIAEQQLTKIINGILCLDGPHWITSDLKPCLGGASV
jgi:hypothetical protein